MAEQLDEFADEIDYGAGSGDVAPPATPAPTAAAPAAPVDEFADEIDYGVGAATPEAPEDNKPNALKRGFVETLVNQNPKLMAKGIRGLASKADDGFIKDLGFQSAKELDDLSTYDVGEYKTRSKGLFESGSFSEFMTALGEGVGGAGASMLPSAVMGLGAGAVGKRVAGKPGALVLGGAGAAVPSFLSNYGEVIDAIQKAAPDAPHHQGISEEDAGDAALPAALMITALDVGSLGPVLMRLGGAKVVKDQVIRRITQRIVQEGLYAGRREGITEAVQEVIKDAQTSITDDKPFWTVENAKGVAESGIIGMVTGVGPGAVSGVRRDEVTPKAPPAATPPAGEVVGAPTPPAATPEAVAPQQGTGTTGNATKPVEDTSIGNPQSAPTVSAPTPPKEKPKKGKGKAKAEEIAAKIAATTGPNATSTTTVTVDGVSAEQAVALAAAKPAPTPAAVPVDNEAAAIAQRFAPVRTQPQPAAAVEATQVAQGQPAVAPGPVIQPTPAPVAPQAAQPTEVATGPTTVASPAPPEPVTLPTPTASIKAGPKGRRILLDKSKNEAGKTKTEIARAQERSALNANFTDKTAGPKGTKHLSKAQITAKATGLTAAEKLIAESGPTEAEANWAHKDPKKANPARQAIFQRVEKFLSQVPDIVKKQALRGDPETIKAPEALVREALDFTTALKERDPKVHTDAFMRFLDRELRLRAGDVASVIKDRRDEGDRAKKVQQKPVEQVAAAAPSPEDLAVFDTEKPAANIDTEGDFSVDTAVNEVTAEQEEAPASTAPSVAGKQAKEIKLFDEETAKQVTSGEKLSPVEKAKMIAEMNAKLKGEVTPKGKAKVEEVKEKLNNKPEVVKEELNNKPEVVKETIKSAAIKYDGKTYEGTIHSEAMENAAKANNTTFDEVTGSGKLGDVGGFITSTGRYVSRREAAKIAKESGQATKFDYGEGEEWLAAQDLQPKSKAAPIVERVKKRKLVKPVKDDIAPMETPHERAELARQRRELDSRWAAIPHNTGGTERSAIMKRRAQLHKVESDLNDAESAGDEYPAVRDERLAEVRKALGTDIAPLDLEAGGGRIKISDGPIAKATGHTTARELINSLPAHEHANPHVRAITNHLIKKLADIVGDIEVVHVPHDSLQVTEDGRIRNPLAARWGYYQVGGHWVVLSDKLHTMKPEHQRHVVLHELVHAATVQGLSWGPASRAVKALMDEVRARGGTITINGRTQSISAVYGMRNEREFLAEALTNPEFQEWLANTPITQELATRLNMTEWRGATLWKALVFTVRRALKLPAHMTSALEAAMSLAERTTWALDPTSEAQFSQNAIAARRVRHAAEQRLAALDEVAPIELPASWDEVLDHGRDRLSAFDAFRKRVWVQVLTFDQMRQQFQDTVFGSSLKKLTDALANQVPTMERFRKEYAVHAQEFIDYTRANVREAREFARIALSVRAVDGYIEIGGDPATINQHAKNGHLGKRARRGWQAHVMLPRLQADFNKLSPEGQRLFMKMAKFFSDTHNRLAEDTVTALLTEPGAVPVALNPATLKGYIQRTLDQTLTEDDEKALGGTLFHALEKEASFHRVKGMYFPEMRYGDHVVQVEDDLTDLNGGKLEDDRETVTFRGKSIAEAEKKAKAWVEKQHVKHLSTKTRYYDATTGDEVKADDATGLNDVEYGVSVHMQTKGVYFFDSHTEAAAFARSNDHSRTLHRDIETGGENTGVQDRLGMGYQAHILTGTQMSTLMRSVEQRLAGDENKAQQELVRAILTQAAARMLSGNRISHRRLRSQHVAGASEDFARNVFNYGEAAARHIATAKAMPKVRDAMKEMGKILDNYQGKNKAELVRIRNEVAKRIENGTVEPNEASQWMKDALAISYFTRLGSISSSIVNASQVLTVTAPMLNGRFGTGRGTAAISRAYGDVGIGDNVIAGMMNAVKAGMAWNKANLTNMTDLIGGLRDRVSKLEDGADLVKMIDELVEGNAISLEAGFEIGSAVASGRGTVGQTIAKLDRVLRQLPQGVETLNRATTAIASYRLARESGMNHEKATQFAFDTTKTTQGDYSNSNAPRFFNNQYLRPAMQFRKYAQLISYVMFDAVHRAFAGASREERVIARKQLAHVMATQIALAGALSLPGLEFAKLAFMATSALGLTGTWDDQEDWLRELADKTFGKYWGELITSGVITRAMGIDVMTRLSMADLWTFGGPNRNESESIQAYMFRQFIGSPGTFAVEFNEGMAEMFQGRYLHAAGKMIPFKTLADAAKAADGLYSGKMDWKDAAIKVAGFRTSAVAEAQRKKSKGIRGSQKEEAEGKALGNQYRNALSLGERARLRAKILAFNKTAKSYKHQVPWRSIDKYRGKDYSKTVD